MPIAFKANFCEQGPDGKLYYVMPVSAFAIVVSEDRTTAIQQVYAQPLGKILNFIPAPQGAQVQCSVDEQGVITAETWYGMTTTTTFRNGVLDFEYYGSGKVPGQDLPDFRMEHTPCYNEYRESVDIFSVDDVTRMVLEFPFKAYDVKPFTLEQNVVKFLVDYPDYLYYGTAHEISNFHTLKVSVDGGAWLNINSTLEREATGGYDDVDYASIGYDGFARWFIASDYTSTQGLAAIDWDTAHELSFRYVDSQSGDTCCECSLHYEP